MNLNNLLEIIVSFNWTLIISLWIGLLVLGIFRYGMLAATVHFVCTVLKRDSWLKYRVQQPFVKTEQLRSELKWTVLTGFIFSTMELLVIISNSFGMTQLYTNISDKGWGYFVLSVVMMVFLHDAYFYWTHRLIHWKPLYWIHKIHHDSITTSAFTSFNFHPIEALVQFSILPLIMVVMPSHWLSLTIFLIYSTMFNILWHNSYEFWPAGHVRKKLWNIFSTPTHHNIHHKRMNHNYALYFTYWDRLMGTMHPDYEKIFDTVKERASGSVASTVDPYEKALS